MPRRRADDAGAYDGDLLALLQETITDGPLPRCRHGVSVRTGRGFTHELNPDSPYYGEWVDSHPDCRRSKFPGHSIQLPRCTKTEDGEHEWVEVTVASRPSEEPLTRVCSLCNLPGRLTRN